MALCKSLKFWIAECYVIVGLMSNFTLHRNTNCGSYNDLVNEICDTMESEVEIKKKRDQPRQKEENGNK